ncbi:HAD family hydrolase [Noviherbaspirillum denitrificans]|uniref:Phosphate acetyltransferase n=1 Tax=Noviherbaspirillum denitrificans TaxID=1968433 RepID=A0A254TGG7_9BURK|nr:HAD family hydrolase [Noviherbaspirillum denitrificans]OWW21751.1 phosphate acetyltransferase [Noviherbaspirillum denitrificans]
MKPIIALDADGVLLDYHQAYAKAWAKAFGALPAVRDPLAYWPIDRWDVRRLAGAELALFRACFDHQYWSTIPAMPGAQDACCALAAAGYELVCVSAIEAQFEAARLDNLRRCGFPIERVIATANAGGDVSPKAAALRELRPVVFVDDFLPYLRGIPVNIHAALVLREPNGSPNAGDDLAWAHSQHADLASFTTWWLNR